MKRDRDAPDEEGWEFGDVWKQEPSQPEPQGSPIEYVDILRGDMGEGFDDSFMMGLVVYLGSVGIRATYDAVPLAIEVGPAIKTYALKVEAGKEEEAREYLKEKGLGGT